MELRARQAGRRAPVNAGVLSIRRCRSQLSRKCPRRREALRACCCIYAFRELRGCQVGLWAAAIGFPGDPVATPWKPRLLSAGVLSCFAKGALDCLPLGTRLREEGAPAQTAERFGCAPGPNGFLTRSPENRLSSVALFSPCGHSTA